MTLSPHHSNEMIKCHPPGILEAAFFFFLHFFTDHVSLPTAARHVGSDDILYAAYKVIYRLPGVCAAAVGLKRLVYIDSVYHLKGQYLIALL